jgi:hypothetical protein
LKEITEEIGGHVKDDYVPPVIVRNITFLSLEEMVERDIKMYWIDRGYVPEVIRPMVAQQLKFLSENVSAVVLETYGTRWNGQEYVCNVHSFNSVSQAVKECGPHNGICVHWETPDGSAYASPKTIWHPNFKQEYSGLDWTVRVPDKNASHI